MIEVLIEEIHVKPGKTIAVFSHPKWLLCRNAKGACMILQPGSEDGTIEPLLVNIEPKSSNPLFPGKQCTIVPEGRFRAGMKIAFLNDNAPLRAYEEE